MFEFGKNWQNYILSLNDDKIASAQASLKKFLGLRLLKGKRFCDAGSGSGLFSLAARNLGANVISFDSDKNSVDCTKLVRKKYYPADPDWVIKNGSLLNSNFIKSLGKFDIVYCWGVAHHTGNMEKALANLVPLVKKNGLLYVAIYNDQGAKSRIWGGIKRIYNQLPIGLKHIYLLIIITVMVIKSLIVGLVKLKFIDNHARWKNYSSFSRGMNIWNDYVDWIGGYPFEVAKPEVIFDFYKSVGFELLKIKTCGGGLGNNEYLFRKK